MSGFRRSPLSRFHRWVGQQTHRWGRWLNFQWLTSWNRSVQRRWSRGLAALRRLIAPKWLIDAFHALQLRLRRTRSSMIRKRQQVEQTVARSAVGEGAKKLARSGRVLEFRLSTFFVEGAKFLGTIVAGLVPAPLRRMFARLGWQFGQLGGVLWVFVGRWFRTRHYWHLLGGLPAFLLALPLAYCMIRMPFYTADRKVKHYRRAAEDCAARQGLHDRRSVLSQIVSIGAMNDRVEFLSAINTIASGNEAEGVDQIRRLAPEDQPGYAPAHLLDARWYLDGKSPLDRAAAADRADRHLQFALDREPGNVEVRPLRARHMQQTGRWDDAASELQHVVKQLPERGLSLAEIYAQQGRWDAAREEVDKVLALFDGKKSRHDDLNAL